MINVRRSALKSAPMYVFSARFLRFAQIRHVQERTHYLHADDESEYERWLAALQKVCYGAAYTPTTPVSARASSGRSTFSFNSASATLSSLPTSSPKSAATNDFASS